MSIMTIPRTVASCACLAALAACGGTEGLPPEAALSYDELFEQGRVIYDAAARTPVTPEANMPATGTAGYAGIAAISSVPLTHSVDDGELLGTVRMDADFASNSVSGTMGNFREDFTDAAYQGELKVENGQISGNGFTADVSGQLSPQGGSGVTYDGVMAGEFRGNSAEMIDGGFSGTITLPNNSTNPFYGLIAAGRL